MTRNWPLAWQKALDWCEDDIDSVEMRTRAHPLYDALCRRGRNDARVGGGEGGGVEGGSGDGEGGA